MLKDSPSSHREPTSRKEIQRLLRLAERDLIQAKVPGLYPDGRFAFAYNAALQLATAYLRLYHVRVRGSYHHLHTAQELKTLLPHGQRQFGLVFEQARRKRHKLMYDQAGVASEAEAQALITAVQEFRDWLCKELAERFPAYASGEGK